LAGLTGAERDCVDRYVAALAGTLGETLEEVWLFGSAARGDMWADFWPMHSDIDLLVVTSARLSEKCEGKLLATTYDLYLQSGRQISPAFATRDQLHSEQARLQAAVNRDGIRLWPKNGSK
jgi:predicted nucleotidyltransferase